MKRRAIMVVIVSFLLVVVACPTRARQVVIRWDAAVAANLAGYKIYVGTTYNSVSTKSVAPYNLVRLVGQNCACLTLDTTVSNVFFIGVTAYDTLQNESGISNIVYWLAGNIVGSEWDNTVYTSARVDGLDLTTLGVHFGESVTWQSFNCNDCSTIFALPYPPSESQACDLNRDGRVDGLDLIELGLHFGNSANR